MIWTMMISEMVGGTGRGDGIGMRLDKMKDQGRERAKSARRRITLQVHTGLS